MAPPTAQKRPPIASLHHLEAYFEKLRQQSMRTSGGGEGAKAGSAGDAGSVADSAAQAPEAPARLLAMLYVAIAAAWETFDKSNRTFAKLWWNSVLKGGDGHDGRMDWPIFRAMVRNRHAADPPGLAIGASAVHAGS